MLSNHVSDPGRWCTTGQLAAGRYVLGEFSCWQLIWAAPNRRAQLLTIEWQPGWVFGRFGWALRVRQLFSALAIFGALAMIATRIYFIRSTL